MEAKITVEEDVPRRGFEIMCWLMCDNDKTYALRFFVHKVALIQSALPPPVVLGQTVTYMLTDIMASLMIDRPWDIPEAMRLFEDAIRDLRETIDARKYPMWLVQWDWPLICRHSRFVYQAKNPVMTDNLEEAK